MPLRSTLFCNIYKNHRVKAEILLGSGEAMVIQNSHKQKNSIHWFICLSGRAKNSSVFNDEPFRAYNKKQLVIVKVTLPQQSRLSQHSFYNSLTTNSFNNSSGIM